MRKTLLMALLILGMGQTQAQMFDERPDILVCSVSPKATGESWDKFVFYISGTQKNGDILYKSLTSNPVLVTIDLNGKITAPNLEDCHNKHLDELRDQGRVANFGKP